MTDTLNNLLQKMASDLNKACVTFAVLKGYIEGSNQTPKNENKQHSLLTSANKIKFSNKEIKNLPKEIQKLIIEVPVRVKQNGVLEARMYLFGKRIGVSSKNVADLKTKFLDKIEERLREKAAESQDAVVELMPSTFKDLAEEWLNTKRATIKEPTYNFYVSLLNFNICPIIGDRKIEDIKQIDVQNLVNEYFEQKKYRTSLKIYQTLNSIFEFAIGNDLLVRSPMRLMRPPKYEEKIGKSLTLEEERTLISLIGGSKCKSDIKSAFIILLYAGIRRSELASLEIKDGFVSVLNAKTRKGFVQKRRYIPITPMLQSWINDLDIESASKVRLNSLTQAFKRLMPNHHLHELRHTYITRCQECGVSREVVSVWAGHAADNTITSNVYTHFSKDFMLSQGKKVIYTVKEI